MNPELLEIQPRELKFTFELKKQSSCSVQLVNNSDEYVAFKVKTTSPNKYCVRPNIGIIKPNSTCDFTVIMQAQRLAPPDTQCKDKFLIQSTIVPFGTTAEEITPGVFAKDNGKYIEENKLKVVLISPPHSPVLLPINGALKQQPTYEASILNDQVLSGVENLPLSPRVAKNVEEFKTSKDEVEFRPAKAVEELKFAKDNEELKLAKDIEELKSKLNELESKLSEVSLLPNFQFQLNNMVTLDLGLLVLLPSARGRNLGVMLFEREITDVENYVDSLSNLLQLSRDLSY